MTATTATGALSPAHASQHLYKGISEYLTTSFSLAEPHTAARLRGFLQDPDHGVFYGPYVRTRLPYAPATNWQDTLGWLPRGFVPYDHQARAFARLASQDATGRAHTPQPTLIVTGTGSGKTESFLYPILDHARRAAALGKQGVKALILYPMNALAADQANRLAGLIAGTDDPRLGGVRAGIYTGDSATGSATTVSAHSLITDQDTLRKNPPDILLTNYKMLDQLLLRPADRGIWKASAHSLQYLVLDEFHTYDGAQGTDVALLLRRLGLMLADIRGQKITSGAAPLGAITPVATSATLGNDADPSAMLTFAATVFGRTFGPEAIITERLLDVPQWQGAMEAEYGREAAKVAHPSAAELGELAAAVKKATEGKDAEPYVEVVRRAVVDKLLGGSAELDSILARYPHHPLFSQLITAGTTIRHLDELATATLGAARTLPREEVMRILLTFLADTRARLTARSGWKGKSIPGVELHLWVRDVSRVDRDTSPRPDDTAFRWADTAATAARPDATPTSGESAPGGGVWLPACYCRHCGRSGWSVATEPNSPDALELNPATIRALSLTDPSRMRPLIDATPEARARTGTAGAANGAAGFAWFNATRGTLEDTPGTEQERDAATTIPVLTYDRRGKDLTDHARTQTCPACGERDAIRFIGSSVATLLSVALSNLFGMPGLDAAEKKTLVFTDSVQDAAHRAGFVQARSHAFGLRTLITGVVDRAGDQGLNLDHIVDGLVAAAGTDARRRFELLPRTMADYKSFKPFWSGRITKRVPKAVTHRLALDLALECGQRSDLPRSLTQTGTLTVGVSASDAVLDAAAEAALDAVAQQTTLFTTRPGACRVAWARGVLELIRLRGGINTPLLGRFLRGGANAYLLNTTTARASGVPAFPPGGAPEFPRRGGGSKDERSVTNIGGKTDRYAQWTARILDISPYDAGAAVANLLDQLAHRGILDAITTDENTTLYALPASRIVAARSEDGTVLRCTVCSATMGLDPHGHALLRGAPCWVVGCTGTLEPAATAEDYYRKLYRNSHPRSVVAAEHTSLLETKERQDLEDSFRGIGTPAPDAPNVLVATPTLEMGIDIGDLSTVMLSSLPRSVASYVQRVGRAGRLSGNSLILATIQGRGEALTVLDDPLTMIAGAVEPPSAFLRAREILRRQFIARVLDTMDIGDVRDARGVFAPVSEGGVEKQDTPLADRIIERVSSGIHDVLVGFISALGTEITPEDAGELSSWVHSNDADGLAAQVRRAADRWLTELRELHARRAALVTHAAELEQRVERNARDQEADQERRNARATQRAVGKQISELTDKYWINALELYGLLPNFTLLDDTVELTVSVSTFDPDKGEMTIDPQTYTRGLASAITELAPGATFYAKGIAARIDSVEITNNNRPRTWRICPDCSYAQEDTAGAAPARVCPWCGSAGFGGAEQRLPVLPMTKVSAQVQRDRASITDSTDDRKQTRFNQAVTLTIPDGGDRGTWYTTGTGFGVTDLRRVNVSWLNLGKQGQSPLHIAGGEVNAPLFEVCAECGHVPAEPFEDSRRGHRPWCSRRTPATALEDPPAPEHFALARTLNTQGLLLSIPAIMTARDTSALPTFAAALRLVLSRMLGGKPQHITMATVTKPKPAGSQLRANPQALLIYDEVPGGTGYLTQFAQAPTIRRMLLAAYEVVSTCECAAKDQLCCPKCLLPFALRGQADKTSRALAAEVLYNLLADVEAGAGAGSAGAGGAGAVGAAGGGVDSHGAPGEADGRMSLAALTEATWEISAEAPKESAESVLEIRFRELLGEALKKQNFSVETIAQAGTEQLRITSPTSRTEWMMKPQVHQEWTTPDFVFETIRGGNHKIAVYLDGYTYHRDQLPEDAQRRNRLRDNDWIVWSLTWDDLGRYENGDGAQRSWYDPATPTVASARSLANADELSSVRKDPFSQLIDLLREPRPQRWQGVAKQAHAVLVQRGGSVIRGNKILVRIADDSVFLVAAPTTDIHLIFDAGHKDNKDNWNTFLAVSNLIGLEGNRVVCEVVTNPPAHINALYDAPAAPTYDPYWQDCLSQFDPNDEYDAQVIAAIEALAQANAPHADDDAEEIDGLPFALVWPEQRIALDYGDGLELDGWQVLDPAAVAHGDIPEALRCQVRG